MSGDQASEVVVINASPERVYEVLCDFDNYPKWATDIKSVDVLSRDDSNRPHSVKYTAEAFGRHTDMSVVYDYSAAPTTISWQLDHGDIEKDYSGSFTLRAVGDQTELTFLISADVSVPIPSFIKRRVESRIIETLCNDLKQFVETNI